jgi:hypothetical protein
MIKELSAIDGECEEGRYTLLASSTDAIQSADRLTTRQCLDFLLDEAQKSSRLFGYGIGLDVCHWIADLTDRQKKLLAEKGRVYTQQGIRFYRLIYRPGAYFTVQQLSTIPTGNVATVLRSATVVDLMKWFRKPFAAVCEDWDLGDSFSRVLIRQGKESRGQGFEFSKYKFLLSYNSAEIGACRELAEKIREGFLELGLPFTFPFTIGTVAGSLAAKNRIQNHWQEAPKELETPIRSAFFGGREQCARYGHFPSAVQWDIKSAYGWALMQMPSMRDCVWAKRPNYELEDHQWYLAKVSWDIDEGKHPVMPFPFRDADGRVHYPPRGTGWYWSPLVRSALRNYPEEDIRILDNWCLWEREIGKPFNYIGELFNQRQASEDQMGGMLKMLIVATWGRLCSSGLRKAKTRGMLDWAGMVTALIQERTLDAIHVTGEREFISCCVDGFWTTNHVAIGSQGDNIGDWKIGIPSELLLLRPIFYWKKEAGEPEWTGYTSGIPQGGKLAEQAIKAWRETGWRTRSLSANIRQCRGLLACNQTGDFSQMGQFVNTEYTIPFNPGFGISGHECPTRKGAEGWRQWLPYWPPKARREAESAPFTSRVGMVDDRWKEKESAHAIEETMD